MGDTLTPDEVRKIRYTADLAAKSGLGDTDLVHDLLAVCDSHEALRRKVQGAVPTVADLAVKNAETITALRAELAEMREQRLDMMAVARRYRDGFIPTPNYWVPFDTTNYDGLPDSAPKVTDAERAALDALEEATGAG